VKPKHSVSKSFQPTKRAMGFNIWAMSINLLLLGALLVMALRIVPTYMEYLTVRDLITRAAQEYDPRNSRSIAPWPRSSKPADPQAK
jgi:hypothetical protein